MKKRTDKARIDFMQNELSGKVIIGCADTENVITIVSEGKDLRKAIDMAMNAVITLLSAYRELSKECDDLKQRLDNRRLNDASRDNLNHILMQTNLELQAGGEMSDEPYFCQERNTEEHDHDEWWQCARHNILVHQDYIASLRHKLELAVEALETAFNFIDGKYNGSYLELEKSKKVLAELRGDKEAKP